MRFMIPAFLAAFLIITPSYQAKAETAAIGVHFITPQEAADLAHTKLSRKGRVVIVESQHVIVVNDDDKHVAAVRALIEQLDKAPLTLQVRLHMDTVDKNDVNVLSAQAERLPGGWLRLNLRHSSINTDHDGRYTLQMISGNGGRIETGTIQPNRPEILQWLSAHGIPRSESIEMVPITTGFNIEAQVSGHIVHLWLHPWIRRQQKQAGLEGETQMLIGLGTAGNPQTPPSMTAPSMRIYGQPVIGTDIQQIAISEADTELNVPLGHWVTIVAVYGPSSSLGQALLSNDQNSTIKDLLMRFRIDKSP